MTARNKRAISPSPRARTRPPAPHAPAATPSSPRQATGDAQRFVLRLYVTGTTAGSTRAIQTVRRICEERLQGSYDLEVIDLYKLPALAKHDQIIATPTLVQVLPLPLRRLIGDLSNVDKVLFGLDVREASR